MQIIKQGESYRASHISGPMHNRLSLTVGRGQTCEFDIRTLPPMGDCRHDPLNEDDVRAAITAGLNIVNDRLGANYTITVADIVENDTWRPGIYEHLTIKIVEHVASEAASSTAPDYQ